MDPAAEISEHSAHGDIEVHSIAALDDNVNYYFKQQNSIKIN